MDRSSGVVDVTRAGTPPSPETSLDLDGDGTRISQARRMAADFLAVVRDTRGVPVTTDTVEVAQLVVSELVTNARRHAPGPARLRLQVVDGVLRIELSDGSPVLPTARAIDPDRVGQHGLEIVTALAQRLTVERTATGKRLTADLPLARTPAASVR